MIPHSFCTGEISLIIEGSNRRRDEHAARPPRTNQIKGSCIPLYRIGDKSAFINWSQSEMLFQQLWEVSTTYLGKLRSIRSTIASNTFLQFSQHLNLNNMVVQPNVKPQFDTFSHIRQSTLQPFGDEVYVHIKAMYIFRTDHHV